MRELWVTGHGGKAFGAISLSRMVFERMSLVWVVVRRIRWGGPAVWGNQTGQLRVMEDSCVTLNWSPKHWPQSSPEALLDL